MGPRAGQIAADAGEHAGLALKLLAEHGDDALAVVAKQSSLTQSLATEIRPRQLS